MPTRVRSYSKINLLLGVGPPRVDGFHGLTTVYQTLGLHDFVTVSAVRTDQTWVTLKANHAGVPTDARNTAWKMVTGALQELGICAEVEISIDKRLPVQGGMGGGSANAVAALLGLERELNLALSGTERLRLAATVGSDVPLFLLGGTVLGLGRGEQVYPVPDLPAIPCVVAVPEVGVSTALAFTELDKRFAEPEAGGSLTFQQADARLEELSYALAAVWTPTGAASSPSGITRADGTETFQTTQRGDLAENPLLALVRTGIENDFEEVAFSQHPSLRSTKRDLLGDPGDGALCAALSGSGSALFGLYESQAAASEAQQRVQRNGTRAILTETLPRPDYWKSMFS